MIAVITYDAPHRKTQDVIVRLKLEGFRDIHMVVIPWIERKSFVPLYSHRPSRAIEVPIELLCARMSLEFTRVEIPALDDFFSKNDFAHILIGGAGIFPAELAKNHKIINAHPGYLPYMKGLDALKWAIYQNQPIGATTHYISPETDEGELIDKRLIPVKQTDTFHSLAYRVYETEIEMLVNAISLIDEKRASLESLHDDNYIPNRRMPNDLEPVMMERFELLRLAAQ